jgi:glycosyltransferase involved in cell wall biosynthesis
MDQQRTDEHKWIGFVSNSAWYIYIHRWDVIRFLIDKGYHILIIAPEDRTVKAFDIPEIKYVPLAFSNKSRNLFDAWSLYSRLKKLYKTYQPVCLFHYAIKANIFGNFAAKKAGIPCVSIIIGIGYSFLKTNWLYFLVKTLYRKTLRIPEEVWFMNNEDGAFFIQHKLVEVKKVHVLHGEGINTDYYKPDDWVSSRDYDGFTFIIATRLLYSKGIGTIADAVRILKNKGYEFRCLLLGALDPGHPDGIPDAVIDSWQKEGIYDVIPFTEDVRPWLAKADCFLLPSYYNEGLPRCLMEAASMRLPIITSRQKGCREAITEGVSGLFCNSKDPVDLAEQMESMMNMTAEQRFKMGKAGRLLMQQKFAIERICKEYLRILKKKEAGM